MGATDSDEHRIKTRLLELPYSARWTLRARSEPMVGNCGDSHGAIPIPCYSIRHGPRVRQHRPEQLRSVEPKRQFAGPQPLIVTLRRSDKWLAEGPRGYCQHIDLLVDTCGITRGFDRVHDRGELCSIVPDES